MTLHDDVLWAAWAAWIRERLTDLRAEDQAVVDHLWNLTERLWQARTDRYAVGDGQDGEEDRRWNGS
jgi:hypothetical protein